MRVATRVPSLLLALTLAAAVAPVTILHGSAAQAATTVSSRSTTQLAVTPKRPAAGERVEVRGTAPHAQVRVRLLQSHRGSAWRVIATTRTARDGSFRFTLRPDAVVRLRVVEVGRRATWKSRPATVKPVAPERVPRLDIVTDNGQPVTSGEDYLHATLALDPRDSGATDQVLTSRLRVRGHSTSWIRTKLSYKVKLDAKSSVLGMPASKNWVLLANFYDRSMLRNDVAFEAAHRIGVPWAPRMHPVEVWLNGRPAGLYQLGEGIEAEPDRADRFGAGGVLLEADSWADDDPVFTTDHGLQTYIKEPEDIEPAVVDTVATKVQDFEDALYGSDYRDPDHGYRAFVDVDSFVDWWLVNELMKNLDSPYNNSIWMLLGSDGRLRMGPVWDFDQAAGNRTDWALDDPRGWFLRRNWYDAAAPRLSPTQMKGPDGHWLNRMFSDPWFQGQADERWQEVRASLVTLPAYVTQQADEIARAAGRNFSPTGADLPVGPTYMDPEPAHVFRGTWRREADALRTWLATRLTWMDNKLG